MVPASSWEVPSACQVGGGPRRISGTWNKHSHKKTKHLTNCMQICTNDEIAPNRAESKSTVWVIAACITPDKVCWLLPRRAAVLIHRALVDSRDCGCKEFVTEKAALLAKH